MALFMVLTMSSGSLFLIPLSTLASTEWDRSSLSFDGASGDCEELTFTICNTGETTMSETVAYQVWYIESGNPRDGEMVDEGVIPVLGGGACEGIPYTPENGAGIYGFSAMQPAGHPGTGVLWSVNIPVYDCCTEPDPSYLKVTKIVEGGEASSEDFTMHISDIFDFVGSADGVTNEVEPGMYQVTETGSPDKYELIYSGACGEDGLVAVAEGETKECILTNTYTTECGDGDIEGDEECDDENDNGVVCEAVYGQSCTYCSNICSEITLDGPYCGDEIVQDDFEECDDGPSGSSECTTNCTIVEEDVSVLKAHKVVCNNESDLPNWANFDGGDHGSIDANTAIEYVANNENCHLAVDWSFEWGYGDEAAVLSNDLYGPAPAGSLWSSFDSQTNGEIPATALVPLGDSARTIWVREVLPIGYIPFTGADTPYEGADFSAEMYCTSDFHKFDNNEWIVNPEEDAEYYCVAFNTLIEEPKGSLKVCKYEDFDGLYETDDTEPLAANWTFTLVDESGAEISLTTPDDENCVYFTNLLYGDYTLSEEDRDGWFRVSPEEAVWEIIIDSEEEEYAHYTNAQNPCGEDKGDLEVCKLIDTDGLVETDEDRATALGQVWEFVVTYPDESTESIFTTLENNCVKLKDLKPGSYSVSEALAEGWTLLLPSENNQEMVVVKDGLASAEFVNYEIPEEETSLKVCKYEDSDASEETSDDRSLVDVWEFTLEGDDYSKSQETKNGCTVFENLQPGEYTISETMKSDWYTLIPNNGTDDIVLEDGVENTYDFVNYYEEGTYCGDGIKQSPNDAGTKGPKNDGYEECDGKDGVPDDDDYSCNSSCVLKKESNGGGGGGGRSYIFESKTEEEPEPEPEVLGEEGEPILLIIKTVGQEFANPGDTGVDYEIVIKNTGNLSAFNVVVTDKLPIGLVYTGTVDIQMVWEIGDLLEGAEYLIEYEVDVLASAEAISYINTAEAVADNHNAVSDTAALEIRAVEVLAVTGFSIPEFIVLFFALMAASGTAFTLQKQLE